MPLERVKKGAGKWKLHVIIQSFTFMIFPLVGLGFGFVLQTLWPTEPQQFAKGFSSVRFTFHRLHLRGANLGGRREHSRGHPERSLLQYCGCPPDSARQFAHARDRQNRVRFAWTSFAGDYPTDPPAVCGRGWTSLFRPSLGGCT